MSELSKKTKGILAALVVNVIFGFSFLFSKSALDYAHPLVILSARFTVSFLVLNLLWLFGAFKLNLKGKPKKWILIMALCQPMLYFTFELYGIENTSSALSGVIISLVPVAVMILSAVFLREKPSFSQVLFSMLSLAAVVAISLLSADGSKSKLTGIVLLLGAVLCAAVFNILSRHEAENYSPFERTYIMFLVGAVGFNLLTFAVLRGNWVTEVTAAVCHIGFWMPVLYLSVMSSILAFMLYNYSTSVLTPVMSASFSNLITVVSVLAGMFILKEEMSVPQLVCCTLIILGVFGVNR